jgi:UDP-N-acetyl-D-mannosaminuronate dehydrogenase
MIMKRDVVKPQDILQCGQAVPIICRARNDPYMSIVTAGVHCASSIKVAEAIVVAVAHQHYMRRSVTDYFAKVRENDVFIDVKSRFSRDQLRKAGLHAWRL